jgi:hypothetical protein
MHIDAAAARIAAQMVALIGHRDARVTPKACKSWSSVTFHGHRHGFAIADSGITDARALRRLEARLADHEFVLAGRLVADVTLARDAAGALTAEVLTVDVI